MNVKNITLNCHKPRHFGNSVITDNSSGAKKRYKRYSEMDDDTLMLKSTLKAHDDVKQGSKMKLYKAMPQITAGIISTAIAITQPGKLSKKVNSGLGFLVATGLLFGFSNKISKVVNKTPKEEPKQNKDTKNNLAKAGIVITGAIAATYGVLHGGKKAVNVIKNSSSKVSDVLRSDGAKFIEEINSSKLGKFVEEKVIPFEQKHASKIDIVGKIAPFGVILGSSFAQAKLGNDIQDDIKEKTKINFIKGKLVQQEAKEEYDNIKAVEA